MQSAYSINTYVTLTLQSGDQISLESNQTSNPEELRTQLVLNYLNITTTVYTSRSQFSVGFA